MKRLFPRAAAVLAALAAVALAVGPAGASIGTRVIVATACTTTPSANISQAPDGQVRGFIETGCDGTISYVTDNIAPGGWVTEVTPYRGVVLATTQDAQATYLLYRASDGVRITKVLHDRTMTKGNLLSAAVGGGLEGTVAARGGLWMAVWTEPKASGGFGLHAAGSRNYVASPKDRIVPAGAGVDDSAPVLMPSATGNDYVLAFARHTASGYHLMLGHGYPRGFVVHQLDTSKENPQPSLLRSGAYSYLAWIHGNTVRLAWTAGPSGTIVPLYQVAAPQAPGTTPLTNPRLGIGCGRLFLGYQADTENAGKVYVNTFLNGHWVQHVVDDDTAAAPVLSGIAAHCESGAVLWTSAAHVFGVMVA
jgi:hypothetical protein